MIVSYTRLYPATPSPPPHIKIPTTSTIGYSLYENNEPLYFFFKSTKLIHHQRIERVSVFNTAKQRISWKINLNTTRMRETQTFPHNLNIWTKPQAGKCRHCRWCCCCCSPSNAPSVYNHLRERYVWLKCMGCVYFIFINVPLSRYELAALSQQTSAFYLFSLSKSSLTFSFHFIRSEWMCIYVSCPTTLQFI